MLRAQSLHPLDPLSAAEITVAVSTVRAAGATPEVFIWILPARLTDLQLSTAVSMLSK